MKKLDWYILKKFLSTFFFAIFLFAVIAIVIDVSEKTDDFVRSGLGLKDIVTSYYFGFIPHIIALLLPRFVPPKWLDTLKSLLFWPVALLTTGGFALTL